MTHSPRLPFPPEPDDRRRWWPAVVFVALWAAAVALLSILTKVNS